ncbi:hypothetical protein [Nocardioides sp. KR10-350]|uniref:hypothetical protein n=1 Tax=Nocardioides cheoyonin TaxID=3156615 RepID=UPI0032B32C11
MNALGTVVSVLLTVAVIGTGGVVVANSVVAAIRDAQRRRREEQQRAAARVAVLRADQQLAAKHRQARMEMNVRAKQGWRNLAE